ncbi:MAG: glutamine-hydrolyzing GMP synthase [Planctomycetes bacterium]|nr:glutamine-hydrolyzing GMP synthase [Planctomycetota bacterium]
MTSLEWIIMFQTIAVLDFGSQYTGLIVRRLRELRVCARLFPGTAPAETLRVAPGLVGVILSGGPDSVYAEGAPAADPRLLELGVPVLGICYGAQWLAVALGNIQAVRPSGAREGGRAEARRVGPSILLESLPERFDVWMSHGDEVADPPAGAETFLATRDCRHAGFAWPERRFFGVQFHPEVRHTPTGVELLRNFCYAVCGAAGDWTMPDVARAAVEDIREKVGSDHVVLGLSGGVDSTVAALLLQRAIPGRHTCIFIDNGLLRQGEFERVVSRYGHRFNIRGVRAEHEFLSALAGVTDPEAKRKTVGRVFVEVFRREAKNLPSVKWLAQGTLYPDVIESAGPTSSGQSGAVIKSHHNVGGLPEALGFGLVEPLRELFKDEVRELGAALGLPEEECWRHPFPGPGLAVRIVGEVTKTRADTLRTIDAIVMEEVRAAGWYRKLWQAFAVLLPSMSVGVVGDHRTYGEVAALRMVESDDGMTADWAEVPAALVRRISTRITNEAPAVNRVVFDVSSKPPATIEWE